MLRIINYRIAHSCWRKYTNSDAWITDEARFHEDVYISAEQAKQVWKTEFGGRGAATKGTAMLNGTGRLTVGSGELGTTRSRTRG